MAVETLGIDFLKQRCYLIDNECFLDLTGKEIEEHYKRRIQDEDLEFIIDFLKLRENIKYLDLSYNNITSSGFSVLSKYLAKNKNLMYLNLKYNDIETIKNSDVDLSIHWKLKCLVLSGNKLGHSEALSTMIQVNESLVQLELADTGQTMRTTVEILTNFIREYRLLRDTSSIKIIDFSRILPSNKSYETIYMTHVIRFLEKIIPFHNFVSITLRQNCIRDSDVEILMDALSRCTELQSLDLRCNLISSYGMIMLAKVLPFSGIQHLDLSVNRIGNEGASALGLVWKDTRITCLDVSHNEIEDCGLTNLLIGLKERPAAALFVFGNPLGAGAARELYLRVYNGLIQRHTLDLEFRWDSDGNLLYFQDATMKRFVHLNLIAKELSTFRKQPRYLCCIQSQQEKAKAASEEKHDRLRDLFLHHTTFCRIGTNTA